MDDAMMIALGVLSSGMLCADLSGIALGILAPRIARRKNFARYSVLP